MLHGISTTGPFGKAEQSAINAFDANYLLSVDEVMANILHIAHSKEEELPETDMPVPGGHAPPSLHLSGLAVGHTVA
jgi:hypothetical protein